MFVTYAGTDAAATAERAEVRNDVDALRRLDQSWSLGAEIWHSWALSTGGSVVTCRGPQGTLEVPASELGRLDPLRKQYSECIGSRVSVGVGIDLEQAGHALKAATERGGDRVAFYAPDMAPKPEETVTKSEPLVKFVPPVPRDYESEFRQHADRSEEMERMHRVAQSGRLEEIRAQLGETLKTIQTQLPALRQLKDAAPEAHTAILGLIQGVIALGREVQTADSGMRDLAQDNLSQDPNVSGIQKDEIPNVSDIVEKGSVEASEVSSTDPEFSTTVLEKDGVDGTKGAQFKGMNLPPGSVWNGRVKVKHGDGATSWVGGRHGLVQANDPNHPIVGATSHPVSSLRPEGK